MGDKQLQMLKNGTALVVGCKYTMKGWHPDSFVEVTFIGEDHAEGMTPSGMSETIYFDEQWIEWRSDTGRGRAWKHYDTRYTSRVKWLKNHVKVRKVAVLCKGVDIVACETKLRQLGWICMNPHHGITYHRESEIGIDIRVPGMYFIRRPHECKIEELRMIDFETFKENI